MAAATKRLAKEYTELQNESIPFAVAQPDESNLRHWVRFLSSSSSSSLSFRELIRIRGSEQTGTIQGPTDSAYQGELLDKGRCWMIQE